MEIINSTDAPQAIGPYVQAVKSGGFLFCSGQIALNPDGSFPERDVREQTIQVMENLKAVITAGGSSLDRVVKCTIYLVDMNDFSTVNEVYGSYFTSDNKPARATVAVAALPKGAKVEIDCCAEI